MKKRYLYMLLFGIPGFLVASVASLFTFGAVVGVLWIFVFGDDPWPFSIDKLLPVLLVLIFLFLWIASLVVGYKVGKKLEGDRAVNRMHVLISGGIAFLFILIIVLQQFSVGNLGPKSDSLLCSNYCMQKGYAASGVNSPDTDGHTCTCYDRSGNEALKVPWDRIVPK